MSHYLRAVISYDGTDYYGWQIQKSNSTVAGVLQESFKRLFQEEITIVGASRTDAGVHALGQVARFATELSLDPQRMAKLWNTMLPPAIHIRSLAYVPYFHPCVGVGEKTYNYVLFLKRPMPPVARYGWLYGFIHQVDFVKFNAIIKKYQGTHDFASFCKQEPHQSTIRTITHMSARFYQHYGALVVTIKGPSFGRFQIRRMIGYALDIARRPTLAVDYVEELLRNPNHEQTLIKAEGSGLCLRKIVYHPD